MLDTKTPHIEVNGHTPIGWFVNRYGYKKDKITDIENYPLEGKSSEEVRATIERLVYVGVESDKIITNLPEEFEMDVTSLPPKPASSQTRLDKS